MSAKVGDRVARETGWRDESAYMEKKAVENAVAGAAAYSL